MMDSPLSERHERLYQADGSVESTLAYDVLRVLKDQAVQHCVTLDADFLSVDVCQLSHGAGVYIVVLTDSYTFDRDVFHYLTSSWSPPHKVSELVVNGLRHIE